MTVLRFGPACACQSFRLVPGNRSKTSTMAWCSGMAYTVPSGCDGTPHVVHALKYAANKSRITLFEVDRVLMAADTFRWSHLTTHQPARRRRDLEPGKVSSPSSRVFRRGAKWPEALSLPASGGALAGGSCRPHYDLALLAPHRWPGRYYRRQQLPAQAGACSVCHEGGDG